MPWKTAPIVTVCRTSFDIHTLASGAPCAAWLFSRCIGRLAVDLRSAEPCCRKCRLPHVSSSADVKPLQIIEQRELRNLCVGRLRGLKTEKLLVHFGDGAGVVDILHAGKGRLQLQPEIRTRGIGEVERVQARSDGAAPGRHVVDGLIHLREHRSELRRKDRALRRARHRCRKRAAESIERREHILLSGGRDDKRISGGRRTRKRELHAVEGDRRAGSVSAGGHDCAHQIIKKQK